MHSGQEKPEDRLKRITVSVLKELPIILLFTVATTVMHHAGLFKPFENTAFDSFLRLHPLEPKHTLLVDIDNADYKSRFGARSPLSPTDLSKLLADIASGQPRMIVVDIDTSDQGFKDMDLSALKDIQVVWAENATQEDQPGSVEHTVEQTGSRPDNTMPVIL
ncbi:MAG: CHASE2 domain-containing protein [Candidatus Obscuribacter sp.]|nr:CHASE2 domain-containing protein [Candidatus Obscuribacter sp.]